MANVAGVGGPVSSAVPDGAPKANPNGQLADKEVFLQLLVAQIRNQNPLAPSDPKDFLAQLSQFSGVEQMIAMRQELEAIHEALDGQSALLETIRSIAATPPAGQND